MFRKLIIAAAATAALGAAALAPTSASAAPGWHGPGHHGHHGHHGWRGRGFGFGFYGPTYVAGPDCYLVKRVVKTPYGYRVRRISVCD